MTFISTLGQSLDQIDRIKTTQLNLADLQQQVSTGKKTQLFKGLGTDVLGSKRARTDLAQIAEFDRNITIGDRRIKLMIQSLSQIKVQAENVTNAIQIQTQQGEFEMESVSDLAQKANVFIKDLINQTDGDRYLFGGAETRAQPISTSGTLDSFNRGRLDDWVNGTISTDDLVNGYRDKAVLNDTLVGYSAELTQGTSRNVFIRADEFTEVDYTVFANDPAIRDIVAALSMTGQIAEVLDEVTLEADDPASTVTAPGASQQEQNDNFYQMFNDLSAMINQAIDNIDRRVSDLSQNLAQIDSIKNAHTLEKNILEQSVDDIENVDINEAAVKLNALQFQLEASYRVTATLSQLSLVNFI
jgi:flagellar hook-associated protein 3 FlgL